MCSASRVYEGKCAWNGEEVYLANRLQHAWLHVVAKNAKRHAPFRRKSPSFRLTLQRWLRLEWIQSTKACIHPAELADHRIEVQKAAKS